ncbi:MAG: M14 family metallopeptidase [Planctomycetota bacterium]|jgi:hypothetical protein
MSLNAFQPRVALFWLSLMIMSLTAVTDVHAAEYYNNRSLGKHLVSIAEQNRDLMRVDSIARSIGKRRVLIIEAGKGTKQDRKTRPAMLVVAGIEGNDLIGCSVAVSWIEHLAEQYKNDSEITKLLETTTIYVIPRLNPDAAAHFFTLPKFETPLNDKPVDDDHDGLVDEDGPEDLNSDGLITWMRIEDTEGEYILDPEDDRLVLKADHLKSEVGAWRYLSEGIDNDHDELWNEDGPGGVNFNRNFPYNFVFFAPDAGVHQVSEAETRALADFVIEHPNIGLVVTYGSADNLSKTPKGARPAGRRKPMTEIHEDDVGYYRIMGDIYRKALGLDKELEGTSVPGAFSDWMYYHRGRLSLAARAWSPAIAVELSKTAEKKEETAQEQTEENTEKAEEQEEQDSETKLEKGNKNTDKDAKEDTDKRNENERKELKWFDEYAHEAFVKWQAIEHLDFPNQRVEVGGYYPFALTNPPAGMIGQITTKHTDFLTMVAHRLGRIGIRKIESHHLGRSVYEVKIQVENTGFLPTVLGHGQTTRQIHPTRLIIELDDSFFLSGTKITNLPAIQGSGGMVELRHIIRAPNRKNIDFKVISMLAGQVKGTVELPNAE